MLTRGVVDRVATRKLGNRGSGFLQRNFFGMPSKKKNTNGTKYPFRIGRSRTGLGVFATEPIKKGKFIVEYKGPLLTNEQCDKIPDNKYLFEVNARWTINGATRSNLARYINHSCRGGNTDTYILRTHQIKIRAVKNIKPGDELTYNYGKDHFDAYIKPLGCKCDSCRRKRAKERAEARAANERRRKRLARKQAQALAAR